MFCSVSNKHLSRSIPSTQQSHTIPTGVSVERWVIWKYLQFLQFPSWVMHSEASGPTPLTPRCWRSTELSISGNNQSTLTTYYSLLTTCYLLLTTGCWLLTTTATVSPLNSNPSLITLPVQQFACWIKPPSRWTLPLPSPGVPHHHPSVLSRRTDTERQ